MKQGRTQNTTGQCYSIKQCFACGEYQAHKVAPECPKHSMTSKDVLKNKSEVTEKYLDRLAVQVGKLKAIAEYSEYRCIKQNVEELEDLYDEFAEEFYIKAWEN